MAIEDTLATIALVGATLVLAYQTYNLFRATNVLAQIEKRRDRKQILSQRISLGEGVIGMEPSMITIYMQGVRMADERTAQAANLVRGLRMILPKDGDPSHSRLVFSLDYVIMNLNNADGGMTDISGVGKEVLKNVEMIRGELRNNLIPKWRAELQRLSGD